MNISEKPPKNLDKPVKVVFQRSPKLLANLQNALQTLETFTKQHENSSIQHIFSKTPPKGSAISQIMQFGSDFLAACFSKKMRRHNEQTRGEVATALSSLHKHRLFTYRSRLEGDELAERISQAIERFDALSEKKSIKMHWPERLLRYFFKKSGLSLEPQRLQVKIPPRIKQQISFHAHFTEQKVAQLTQHERDLFFMKAITLWQAHKVIPTFADALKIIRSTPIYMPSDWPNFGKNEEVVSLKQIFTPFPGELIVITGKLRKNGSLSSPLPDSFKLMSSSEQTGFPHPSQHTGWALAEPLTVPLLPELTQSTLLSLLQKKELLSAQLLPEGSLNHKAKLQLAEIRTHFNGHAEELIALHRQLACLLIDYQLDPDLFFKSVQAAPSPFDFLAESYHRLNQLFVVAPYALVLENWIEILTLDHPQKRLNMTIQWLSRCEQELEDPFLQALGKRLATASRQIILQYLSEPLEFPPIPLSSFEKTLQAIAYEQLDYFFKQLTAASPVNNYQEQLEKEIMYLKEQKNSYPMIQWLADYFGRKYERSCGL